MVITIGREYGSGGKYIGERLAKELNLKFYDKEILERLSKEEGAEGRAKLNKYTKMLKVVLALIEILGIYFA